MANNNNWYTMRKLLFALFVLMGVSASAQLVYPTETYWMFLNGGFYGNYGNLHISSDGDIDTIKGNAYDFPDSLRVVSPGSRYYLTGVYSGGQYDLDWRRPSKADVSDLTASQVLYGGATGEIAQSSELTYGSVLLGEGLSIGGAGLNEFMVKSTDNDIWNWLLSGATNDVHLVLGRTDLGNGWDIAVDNNSANEFTISPLAGLGRVGIGTQGPQTDFHVVADTIRFEDLDGTGNLLKINGSDDVTRGSATMSDISDLPTITQGYYTPTCSIITNLDAVAAVEANAFMYTRQGDIVTVSGNVDLDPTSSGLVTFLLTLPIASDFTSVYGDASGQATAEVSATQKDLVVNAAITEDQARVTGGCNWTANNKCYITFRYKVK